MSSITKDDISNWLEKIDKDRFWLAEKCGATKFTVDSWFSTRGFPKSALVIIESLMRESTLSPQGRIVASFTTDEFERIESAREVVGSPTRQQFYHDAIMEYAESLLAGADSTQAQADKIPLEYPHSSKPALEGKKRA
jgi:hypothetical protein